MKSRYDFENNEMQELETCGNKMKLPTSKWEAMRQTVLITILQLTVDFIIFINK